MRRPTAEWLLLPLVIAPLVVGAALALQARGDYFRELDRARTAGAHETRRLVNSAPGGTRWWQLELPVLRHEPDDVLYKFHLGGLKSAMSFVRTGTGRLRRGDWATTYWPCGSRFPVGLPAAALARRDTRLAVESGRAPIEIEEVDEGARSLGRLLSAPDLEALRMAPLPAATKAFVVRRWRAAGHDDPDLEEAEALLDALTHIETWWRDVGGKAPAGLHRAGPVITYVLFGRVLAFPPGSGALPRGTIRFVPGADSLVRVEFELTLDDPEVAHTLWSGRLDDLLAGRWRLVAVHGDAWWRAPAFARRAGPIAAGLGVLALLPFVLLVALRKRRRLDEARKRFITELAHDLRTPLTSVRLYAEMLEAGRVPEEGRDEYFSVLARESTRLSSLLANLLDLSRLERGSRRFETRAVDVGEAARASAAAFVALEPGRTDDVIVEGPEDVRAIADPEALSRALANLLENTGKFTTAGTAIRVGWEVAGEGVVVRVADDGPGIPSGERGRLFERFARGATAVRDGIPGTGLGLSLVRELIEGSGGEARHVEGSGGAVFELRLRKA